MIASLQPDHAPLAPCCPRTWRQRGQSMIEYSLVLFAVVVIGVAAFALFQQRQAQFMEDAGDAVLLDSATLEEQGQIMKEKLGFVKQ